MPHTIFIVEDNLLVREGYVTLIDLEPDLAVSGVAGTVREALEQIPAALPDLALVDLSLGGRSGMELVVELTATYPDLPVVVISGHDAATYADEARQAGARAYIMKTDAAEKLLDTIRDVLEGRPVA